MANQMDLECGRSVVGGVGNGGGVHRHRRSEVEEEGSVCSSDAGEGSCYSQFYSTADGEGSYDDYSFACGSGSGSGSEGDEIAEVEASELRRDSSVTARSDISIEIDNGVGEIKLNLGRVEKDCRICHLSLLDISENGVAIELGCSCKGDLAAAHKNCAETWFKIKGNKTCEICNSIARNIVGPNEVETMQHMNEMHALESNIVTAPVFPTSETRTCLNGHRFLNFLLACMVFAFVISWLFHFNIPS